MILKIIMRQANFDYNNFAYKIIQNEYYSSNKIDE